MTSIDIDFQIYQTNQKIQRTLHLNFPKKSTTLCTNVKENMNSTPHMDEITVIKRNFGVKEMK